MTASSHQLWFRFSLAILLVMVTGAALVAVGIRQPMERNHILGTWRGAKGDERFTLTFVGESLVIHVGSDRTVTPPRESRFRVDPQRGLIDIHRDDGLQQGLYAVDGDTLTLNLADVNQPRPHHLAANRRSSVERRYVFQRQR